MTDSAAADDHGPADEGMRLPYREGLPVFAGAVGGLLLRIIFWGDPGEPYSAMLSAFVYGSPILVGAVTVYLAPAPLADWLVGDFAETILDFYAARAARAQPGASS